jgi:hypothetical protein
VVIGQQLRIPLNCGELVMKTAIKQLLHTLALLELPISAVEILLLIQTVIIASHNHHHHKFLTPKRNPLLAQLVSKPSLQLSIVSHIPTHIHMKKELATVQLLQQKLATMKMLQMLLKITKPKVLLTAKHSKLVISPVATDNDLHQSCDL